MDATNDDEATMMAAMGLAGFGSTKVSVLRSYISNPSLMPYTGETRFGQSGGGI